jgi:hypothetical protein
MANRKQFAMRARRKQYSAAALSDCQDLFFAKARLTFSRSRRDRVRRESGRVAKQRGVAACGSYQLGPDLEMAQS